MQVTASGEAHIAALRECPFSPQSWRLGFREPALYEPECCGVSPRRVRGALRLTALSSLPARCLRQLGLDRTARGVAGRQLGAAAVVSVLSNWWSVSRRPRSVPCCAANLRNRVLRSRSAAWPTLRAPGLPTHRRGDRHLASRSDRFGATPPGNPIGSTGEEAATTGSIIGSAVG
jgi:hypothetical protein